MNEATTVAITVVAWNSMAYLPRFFESLDAQTAKDFSVTVIDNASNDGTIEWLQRERPRVATLRNFRNQGFGRGHNQAIQLSLGRWHEDTWEDRYVLVANPDLEFSPQALERMCAYMMEHKNVAACGPKLLRAKTIINDEGVMETQRLTIIDSTGISMKKSRQHMDRGAGEEDVGQYDTFGDVFGISGACMMIRASVIPKLFIQGEFFDEQMFAYKEDTDVCWRMQKMGMCIRFVPEAIVWHHRLAKSGDQGFFWIKAFFRRLIKPAHINILSTRNHLWLLIKNDEFVNVTLHAPWILLYETGKFVVGFFQPSAWYATVQALRGVPHVWRKRREVQKKSIVSGASIRKYFV